MYETGGSPYNSNYEQQSSHQSFRKRDTKSIQTSKGLNQSINKFQTNVSRDRDDDRTNLYATPNFGGVSKSMGQSF